MFFPSLSFETELWNQGFKNICGLDEVGRGSFAGPVVVGAVIFPQGALLPEGINDSKLLKPKVREKLAEEIKNQALAYSIGEIGINDINKYGIDKATQMAFCKALKLLPQKIDFVLIDGFCLDNFHKDKQKAIIKGDQLSITIAAASIIAKVYRDKLMEELHLKYPQYNFFKHKGYGTLEHRQAIKKYGLCEIHRRSFNLDKFL